MTIETNSKALDYRIYVHKNFSANNFDKWVLENLELKNGLSLLDVGCGRGKHLFKVSDIVGSNGLVVGTDISDESLDSCKEKIKSNNIKVYKSDLTKLSENDPVKKYDRILSSFAIYYTSNIEKTFKDLYEFLNKNGILFICGPTKKNNLEFLSLIEKAGGNFSKEFHKWTKFLEEDAKVVLKKLFGNIEIIEFKNPITFPDVDTLYNYWKSTPLYNPEIEDKFKELANAEFEENGEFVTNKVIIGLKSNKNE